jgi:outer membrane cobalamin receptor
MYRNLLKLFIICSLVSTGLAQEKTPDTPSTMQNKEIDNNQLGTQQKYEAFHLGEIVITETRIPNIEKATTNTEISSKDIDIRNDKALADSLQMVPGVKVEQTAKGFSGLSMRGLDHQYVAILIDGVPVIDPYYGGNNIDISMIPVSNVERIIINRGVSSALYGSLGSAGSINIITKKPQELYAKAKVEYGEYTNYFIGGETGIPIGNFYTWIAASRQYSDGYEISKKLTTTKRREWFDKLVTYDLADQSGSIVHPLFSDIDLEAVDNYLNDTGKWNNTEYTKHTIAGKIGYSINDKTELGISAHYYHNEMYSNTFQNNSLPYFDEENNKWSLPAYPRDYVDSSGKSWRDIFSNRAFYWPEDWRLNVSPYFATSYKDFKIRINTFYIKQRNNLEGYFNQNYDIAQMFPNSTNYTGNAQSIFEETAYGIYIMPQYTLFKNNTIYGSIHYRKEQHDKYEKALDATSALALTLGTNEYKVQDMNAEYVTVAIEDQWDINTGAGMLFLSVGASYDAQNLSTVRAYDKNTDSLTSYPKMENTAYIWGTYDSFNPVMAAMYEAIPDLLKIRLACGIKTMFPNLSQYKDIGQDILDNNEEYQIKPETIYNSNTGFEIILWDNALSFRNDYFITKVKNKIARVYDPDSAYEKYDNIEGITAQGIESTLTYETSLKSISIQCTLNYVFTHAQNDEVSSLTYGKRVEGIPTHQFLIQLMIGLPTKTDFVFWGTYTADQIVYVANTSYDFTTTSFSADAYNTVHLHNPIMLNIKLQQKFLTHYFLYVTCKNISDDYAADPFNPGPGRMFYAGLNAEL